MGNKENIRQMADKILLLIQDNDKTKYFSKIYNKQKGNNPNQKLIDKRNKRMLFQYVVYGFSISDLAKVSKLSKRTVNDIIYKGIVKLDYRVRSDTYKYKFLKIVTSAATATLSVFIENYELDNKSKREILSEGLSELNKIIMKL